MNTYGIWKDRNTFGVLPLEIYEAEDEEAAMALFTADHPDYPTDELNVVYIFVNQEAE